MQATAEPEIEECSICMEADIEVRVTSCHHGMCIECARAVCSMRVRLSIHLPAACGTNLAQQHITSAASEPFSIACFQC